MVTGHTKKKRPHAPIRGKAEGAYTLKQKLFIGSGQMKRVHAITRLPSSFRDPPQALPDLAPSVRYPDHRVSTRMRRDAAQQGVRRVS